MQMKGVRLITIQENKFIDLGPWHSKRRVDQTTKHAKNSETPKLIELSVHRMNLSTCFDRLFRTSTIHLFQVFQFVLSNGLWTGWHFHPRVFGNHVRRSNLSVSPKAKTNVFIGLRPIVFCVCVFVWDSFGYLLMAMYLALTDFNVSILEKTETCEMMLWAV